MVALQVCHDKWRGVSWANDSGSVFAVLSCFCFLSTQKEENTFAAQQQKSRMDEHEIFRLKLANDEVAALVFITFASVMLTYHLRQTHFYEASHGTRYEYIYLQRHRHYPDGDSPC